MKYIQRRYARSGWEKFIAPMRRLIKYLDEKIEVDEGLQQIVLFFVITNLFLTKLIFYKDSNACVIDTVVDWEARL